MMSKFKNRVTIILVIFFLSLTGSTVVLSASPHIAAIVKLTLIQFITYPEKREPPTGNWSTIAKFQLRNCSTHAVDWEYTNILTNLSGSGTISIPLQDVIQTGNYIIAIKGYSHLTKEFPCRYFADNIEEHLDLSNEGELLAGDTSNVVDDFVNSLDLSTLVGHLYTNDYKNDLNQDTLVNSLDLSNQVYNLYLSGD